MYEIIEEKETTQKVVKSSDKKEKIIKIALVLAAITLFFLVGKAYGKSGGDVKKMLQALLVGNVEPEQQGEFVGTIVSHEKEERARREESVEKEQKKECELKETPSSYTEKVVINEIAWMGRSESPNSEWIELKNVSEENVNIGYWQLVDKGISTRIEIPKNSTLKSNSYYLLERTNDASVPDMKADQIYIGSLGNTNDELKLYDAECMLVDSAIAIPKWQAGNNTTKQTMERNSDDKGWHTSTKVHGTPGSENTAIVMTSNKVVQKKENKQVSEMKTEEEYKKIQNRNTSMVPMEKTDNYVSPQVAEKVKLTVDKDGNGNGKVVSTPKGIECGDDCIEVYASGTLVELVAYADEGMSFGGWIGSCTGTGPCRAEMNKNISVTAVFSKNKQAAPVQSTSSAEKVDSKSVKVTEVMPGIEGNADYEFVELLNTGSVPVSLSGWAIKKKSGTGNETTLVPSSRLEGKVIMPGKHFLLVNEGGYNGGVVPDAYWAKSYTLAYSKNAVLVYDAEGTKTDELAWEEIPKGESISKDSNSIMTTVGLPTPQNAN